jgi:alpha/beta superfamily hydrolase
MPYSLRFAFKLLIVASMMVLGWSATFALNPSRATPYASIKHSYKNVSFRYVQAAGAKSILLADIAPLHKDKKVVVLICYPDSGNIKKWLGYGQMLAERGYRAIMFDYRGFGGSSSFAIERDTLYYDEFTDDAKAAYCYIKKSYPGCKVGLFGLAMGSIMATELAANHMGDFIIGDSYVGNMEASIGKIEESYKKAITVPLSAASYNSSFASIRQPVLLFNGKYDTVCFADGSTFFNSNRVVSYFYKGGHLEGPSALGSKYFDRIDEFISNLDTSSSDGAGNEMHYTAILLVMVAAFCAALLARFRKLNACYLSKF